MNYIWNFERISKHIKSLGIQWQAMFTPGTLFFRSLSKLTEKPNIKIGKAKAWMPSWRSNLPLFEKKSNNYKYLCQFTICGLFTVRFCLHLNLRSSHSRCSKFFLLSSSKVLLTCDCRKWRRLKLTKFLLFSVASH